METSLSRQQRAIAERQLQKILPLGLCCSALFHTAAIAVINYWAQLQADNNLEITEIERVNIDPEPKPTPTTPAVKSTPKPRPVQPKIAAAPKPKPVKAPPPKPIATPPPVMKITKSAVATKPSIDPFANFVRPTVKPTRPTAPVKTPPQVAIKPDPIPKFPDKLFTDPAPKPSKPAQTQTQPKKTTVARPSKPATPTQPKVAKQPEDLPDLQEPNPTPPGKPDKIAKSPDPIPNTANQTNLGGTKTRQTWANDPTPPTNDPPVSNDDFGSGTPGNNQKIANSPNLAPANSNNQTGLAGGTPKQNRIGANADSLGGEPSNSNDESIAGAPGNNTRIARSQSGGNSSVQNQAGLRGGSGKKRTTPLGGDSNGGGAGIGNDNDEFSGGAPGNIAAAGKSPDTSIQCLRNCEIRYPDTLADADMGKDKILVRVTIDPSGSVTAAQIARSSGNSQLDRVTLDGIKQMQLTAMGKAMTFKVKVSTLTN